MLNYIQNSTKIKPFNRWGTRIEFLINFMRTWSQENNGSDTNLWDQYLYVVCRKNTNKATIKLHARIVVRLIREGPFFFLLCWSKVCGLIFAIKSNFQFQATESSTAGIHKEEYESLVLHSLYKSLQIQIYRISNIVSLYKILPTLKLEIHAPPSTSIWRWQLFLNLQPDSQIYGKSKSRNSSYNTKTGISLV